MNSELKNVNNESLKISAHLKFNSFEFNVQHEFPLQGIVGIFGPSGSGKSTLLRIISGLENNYTGCLEFKGKTLFQQAFVNNKINTKTHTKTHKKEKINIPTEQRKIGLVFQDSRLFPHYSVLKNLQFAAKYCQSSQLSFDEIVELTEIKDLLNHSADKLSGGEQQRVALARALLAEPELLLLDEPISALDQQNKHMMLALLLKVQQTLNLPIFYISHSIAELQQVADYLCIMKKGHITNFGNIHEIIHSLAITPHNELSSRSTNGPSSPSASNSLAENITSKTSLSLPVKEHLPKYGLSVLSLNHQKDLFLPIQADLVISETTAPNGHNKTVRCFINASDISITLSQSNDSSIMNQLAGSIASIHPQGEHVLLGVMCYEQVFFVSITLWSFDELKLSKDMNVFIQFKAGALKTSRSFI